MVIGAKNTLSSICKESKRHHKCIPSRSNKFINYVFYFLKVLDFFFFMEKHFIARRTLG
jgi:hypothetical protein